MIDRTRILDKLDDYLNHNDYTSAERHLRYWLNECDAVHDFRTALLIQNELMGLYRKQGMRDAALAVADAALTTVESHHIAEQIGAATTFLNAATVAAPQMMVFTASPSIFLPNCLDKFSAISANAGTSTNVMGRNANISLNIFRLSRQIYKLLPE